MNDEIKRGIELCWSFYSLCRKTNEMSDLVQLMTRTLKMDNKENCEQSTIPAPESQFKLNRKYRDTLILHGKASEDPEEFQFQEFPSGL